MERADLARAIYERAHLTGEFTLRSGTVSNEYFDKYLFEADPALLLAIAEALAPLVPDGTDALAGLELGGVPIATMLSQVTGLPAVFVRKEAKSYGTCRLAEGGDIDGTTPHGGRGRRDLGRSGRDVLRRSARTGRDRAHARSASSTEKRAAPRPWPRSTSSSRHCSP